MKLNKKSKFLKQGVNHMRRELVQLSTAVKELPDMLANWYCSEKLDGIRAIWAPSTRGMAVRDVAWANREKDKRDYVCSGLWSRYAKPIVAPDWWLDKLPVLPENVFALDGELWSGRGAFQQTISITRSHQKSDDWDKVKMYGFDLISPVAFFMPGEFKVMNGFNHTFKGCLDGSAQMKFQDAYQLLKILEGDSYQCLKQQVLTTEEAFNQKLSEVIDGGGEGLILRQANHGWFPKRVKSSLKYKPFYDDEAYVIKWSKGEGRHSERMGALTVTWKGKEFDIGTGFTDEERDEDEKYWLGKLITFRYLNLTDAGIPSKAHYHRRREEV